MVFSDALAICLINCKLFCVRSRKMSKHLRDRKGYVSSLLARRLSLVRAIQISSEITEGDDRCPVAQYFCNRYIGLFQLVKFTAIKEYSNPHEMGDYMIGAMCLISSYQRQCNRFCGQNMDSELFGVTTWSSQIRFIVKICKEISLHLHFKIKHRIYTENTQKNQGIAYNDGRDIIGVYELWLVLFYSLGRVTKVKKCSWKSNFITGKLMALSSADSDKISVWYKNAYILPHFHAHIWHKTSIYGRKTWKPTYNSRSKCNILQT